MANELNFVGGRIIDGHVVVRMPVKEEPKPSSSGKTLILAGTGGFMPFMDSGKYEDAKFSLNVTIPNPDKE